MYYMHTSPLSVRIYDSNFKKIAEQKIDFLREHVELKEGRFIDAEVNFVKKYGPITFIGIKTEGLDNVSFTQDIKKLALVADIFPREALIKATKLQVRDSVKTDSLIIQTIHSIDELTKTLNTHVKRLREWFELYNADLSKANPDNERFVQAAISDEGIITDTPFSKEDLMQIKHFAKSIQEMFDTRKSHEEYLNKLMQDCCPNLLTLAGLTIGAHLIALAGSMQRLSRMPAQTIQLLGAERALFRFLRSRKGRSPKYGILHEHPLVQKASRKGSAAKTLADKIAIGVKVDYFKGQYVADKLLKVAEAKIR